LTSGPYKHFSRDFAGILIAVARALFEAKFKVTSLTVLSPELSRSCEVCPQHNFLFVVLEPVAPSSSKHAVFAVRDTSSYAKDFCDVFLTAANVSDLSVPLQIFANLDR